MKKILFLLLLISGLFANRYPLNLEYNFLKGCVGKNDTPVKEKYCLCAITYIEKHYTLNQFLEALQDPKQKSKIIKSAVDYCLDVITKEK
jgi:ribosome assembly protein YihI (activator of Der GTPase)